MSASVDINLLLYASDQCSPFHTSADTWLKEFLESGENLNLTWPTIMGYQRIATDPRIFERPMSPQEVMDNMDGLLQWPQVSVITEGPGFWEIYQRLSKEMVIRGNLVPDAHLAALLESQNIRTLYSHDRDFRLFPFLRVIDPLG